MKGLIARLDRKSPGPGLLRRLGRKKRSADTDSDADAHSDDSFFNGSAVGAPPPLATAAVTLTALFDELRDPSRGETDALGVGSVMDYLQNRLGIDINNAELFVALDALQTASVGEIKRDDYVAGWMATGLKTHSHATHARYLRACIDQLSQDYAYFRQIYRHVFVAGREPEQKAIALDNAIVYWSLIFASPGRPWQSPGVVDWLARWIDFLRQKWTRSVSRDMWNMTFEFAQSSMTDPTLSFWSEDGAWPGVIDDFVVWHRETPR